MPDNSFTQDLYDAGGENPDDLQNTPLSAERQQGSASQRERQAHHGQTGNSARILPGLITLAMVVIVAGALVFVYLKSHPDQPSAQAVATGSPTSIPTVKLPGFNPSLASLESGGISRQAVLHTNLPDRPRFSIVQYTVQEGDTLFGIATKFGLKPETILWGNYETMRDNPDAIYVGQVLNILPEDGAYYQWHAGDGLNGVAKYFNVTPDDIVNYPGNNLNKNTVGNYAAPNIAPGTWLIIPGGKREFVDWAAQINKNNPSTGSSMGTGACTVPVSGGAVGSGTYVWPAPDHYLSGYDYTPSINHWGIDVAGKLGDPIYAVDNGVVVYAGWSTAGYGNLIVIDHGDGVETYYGHLSQINVSCGQSVYQTNVIGLMGSTGRSTGPHLHFEMRHGQWGHLDPWNYLPK